MNFKKLTEAKARGRKKLFQSDNLFGFMFMFVALSYALLHGYMVFAYFSMGLVVARIGEIIFEMKHNLFDKPFFHCLLFVGVPMQILYEYIANL